MDGTIAMSALRDKRGMRAVVPGPRETMLEAFELQLPARGQLLVETEASAISPGTELAIFTGIHQWLADPARSWPKFPFVPGYSSVGRVIAMGEDVPSFHVGQRVVWSGRHESHALVNVADGASPIWPIGEAVPAQIAAFALLARFPLTALVQSGQILGQSVAVLGLGLIGQLALRLFSAAGAYPLFGIDPVQRRRMVAATTPGVQAVDPAEDDLASALRALNRDALPDIVVDATGAPNAVRAAMAAVADGGKVIMVGSPRGIAGDVDFYADLHGRSISLIGAHGSALGLEPREKFPFTRSRALGLIVHLLERGKLNITDLITHYVYTGALHAMYDGLLHRPDEFLGVALHWDESAR